MVARLCHTFGPGITEHDNRAASQFFRDAIAGKDIVLKSEGKQRRSYLFVADAVSAMLSVLTSGERGKAYDIASEDCVTTIADLAKMISDAAGVKVRFEVPDEKDMNQRSPIKEQVLNHALLRDIGWNCSVGLKKGISYNIELL